MSQMRKRNVPTITETMITAAYHGNSSSSSLSSGFMLPSSTLVTAFTPATMPPSRSPSLKRGTI